MAVACHPSGRRREQQLAGRAQSEAGAAGMSGEEAGIPWVGEAAGSTAEVVDIHPGVEAKAEEVAAGRE